MPLTPSLSELKHRWMPGTKEQDKGQKDAKQTHEDVAPNEQWSRVGERGSRGSLLFWWLLVAVDPFCLQKGLWTHLNAERTHHLTTQPSPCCPLSLCTKHSSCCSMRNRTLCAPSSSHHLCVSQRPQTPPYPPRPTFTTGLLAVRGVLCVMSVNSVWHCLSRGLTCLCPHTVKWIMWGRMCIEVFFAQCVGVCEHQLQHCTGKETHIWCGLHIFTTLKQEAQRTWKECLFLKHKLHWSLLQNLFNYNENP